MDVHLQGQRSLSGQQNPNQFGQAGWTAQLASKSPQALAYHPPRHRTRHSPHDPQGDLRPVPSRLSPIAGKDANPHPSPLTITPYIAMSMLLGSAFGILFQHRVMVGGSSPEADRIGSVIE